MVVDRERARFAAWYELFPRSQGRDPREPAATTFAEAEWRIPDIAAMGFDVLYMPPIHPIGRTNRKGPNNTLDAGPGDVGSPYGIGSDEGGHDAVAPELGGLEQFLALPPGGGGPRHGACDRYRHPGHARPSLREGASAVVPPLAGREHQVRGEPAEEVPGHLPDRLRRR